MELLSINWTSALDVVFFGFGMVLLILIVLVIILTIFGKAFAPKVRVQKHTKEINKVIKNKEKEFQEEHLPAEYSAAIAMALHLYYSDEHDVESQIITIKTVQRRYSPWSSKIYGLNNLVR